MLQAPHQQPSRGPAGSLMAGQGCGRPGRLPATWTWPPSASACRWVLDRSDRFKLTWGDRHALKLQPCASRCACMLAQHHVKHLPGQQLAPARARLQLQLCPAPQLEALTGALCLAAASCYALASCSASFCCLEIGSDKTRAQFSSALCSATPRRWAGSWCTMCSLWAPACTQPPSRQLRRSGGGGDSSDRLSLTLVLMRAAGCL